MDRRVELLDRERRGARGLNPHLCGKGGDDLPSPRCGESHRVTDATQVHRHAITQRGRHGQSTIAAGRVASLCWRLAYPALNHCMAALDRHNSFWSRQKREGRTVRPLVSWSHLMAGIGASWLHDKLKPPPLHSAHAFRSTPHVIPVDGYRARSPASTAKSTSLRWAATGALEAAATLPTWPTGRPCSTASRPWPAAER